MSIFVLITETRHGSATVSVFDNEKDAMKNYEDFTINREGESKILYKGSINEVGLREIKSQDA